MTLVIEDVSVDFGGIHALSGVSFALEAGAIVGLIGPNGAGKSTLLNCISGITRPTRGRVRLDGTSLSTMSPATASAGYFSIRSWSRIYRCRKIF
jgi:branched-chain amino acid transport system ATP-binding protein